jgi:hypothetical protein
MLFVVIGNSMVLEYRKKPTLKPAAPVPDNRDLLIKGHPDVSA